MFLALLLILSSLIISETPKSCLERGLHYKELTDTCVECVTSEDCSRKHFCGADNTCHSYLYADKLGTFCTSDNCIDAENNVVCGECVDGVAIWTGFCHDYVCEECDIVTQKGATEEHINSICLPKSVAGKGGLIGKYQVADGTYFTSVHDVVVWQIIIITFELLALFILNGVTIYFVVTNNLRRVEKENSAAGSEAEDKNTSKELDTKSSSTSRKSEQEDSDNEESSSSD